MDSCNSIIDKMYFLKFFKKSVYIFFKKVGCEDEEPNRKGGEALIDYQTSKRWKELLIMEEEASLQWRSSD